MQGQKKHKGAAPGWPAFPSPLTLAGLLDSLTVSQWWSPEELALAQQPQLAWLVKWASTEVPYYQESAWVRPASQALAAVLAQEPARFPEVWRTLPLLTKPELRRQGQALHARTVPQSDKPLKPVLTSGSTGIPVEVRSTSTTRQIWNALTLREHLWSRRDFTKRMGAIRYISQEKRGGEGTVRSGWGAPVALRYRSGPSSFMHIGNSMETLADWLLRFDPHYLLAYPSILEPLMDAMATRGGAPPSLEEIRLISEPLDPGVEARLRGEWQVRSTDIYSANEVGYLAFRCREQGRLHLQSEAVLVEILDEAGQACAPGESGRVVITALHNLATPLLRYELGDYATVGERCPCGRGLPVLGRVQGRVRNLVRTPDGRYFWPSQLMGIRSVTAIIQAQFVQTALDTVEVRVVCSRALSPADIAEAVAKTHRALGYPFEVVVVPVESIPRGPTGKFEEFLSLLGND